MPGSSRPSKTFPCSGLLVHCAQATNGSLSSGASPRDGKQAAPPWPLLLLAVLLGGVFQAIAQADTTPILEASGVARHGDSLLLVDDGSNGVYFRFALRGEAGPEIVLDPSRLERVELPKAYIATDLEGIDILADGRVVVLSERLRALFSADGIVADYDAPLSEFGKRGLEGVAVRPLPDQSSQVAVLWEGGYPEYQHVPEQLRAQVGRKALRPLIQLHFLRPGESGLLVRGGGLVSLDVPIPGGREPAAQRFRAPDLVWHEHRKDRWGFIVLLSSQDSTDKPRYMYHWLQRFSADGKRIGKPIDLDLIMPRDLKGVNWEGLGWFEEGQSLVLVHESQLTPRSVAYVLPLPNDWKLQRAIKAVVPQGVSQSDP